MMFLKVSTKPYNSRLVNIVYLPSWYLYYNMQEYLCNFTFSIGESTANKFRTFLKENRICLGLNDISLYVYVTFIPFF